MELMPAVVCLAKNYGIKGVSLYMRLKLGFTNGIIVPGVAHPIHLRKGTSDIPAFQEIFTYHEYDVALDYEPQTIIDAGANVGLASIYFANRYPKATIVSVEPEQSNFEMLTQNVSKYTNIVPLKRAISDHSNHSINVIDEGSGNWGFRTESIDSSHDMKIKEIVMTISLKDIMQENRFEMIDILKIDIEGAEAQLFKRGYEDWLPRTRCLIIELHDRFAPGCSKSVFKAISEYNFSYSQNGENLVFINEDKGALSLQQLEREKISVTKQVSY